MSSAILQGGASGTGSVTVLAPNTNSNQTVTMPDATGTMMVSGNMPAFSAYANTNQTFTSSTHTKVTFTTELFDTNNNFASSRFTPTVAGYYQMSSALTANVSNTRYLVELYKNGTRCNVFADMSTTVNTLGGSVLVYMNGSTDYLEMYVYMTAVSPELYGIQDSTWFTGSLVRAA
jgi:hypothetical protein